MSHPSKRLFRSCSLPFGTPRGPWTAAALVFAAVLAPATARAESAERTRAVSLVTSLGANADHKQALSGLLARAQRTLDRAAAAHTAGDHRHATELEACALELAEMASDLVRALNAERELAELSRRALAAETRAVRAQALVEQTTARRGRAAAQLRALEAERAQNASGVPAKPAPAPATQAPREPSR